MFTKRIFEKKIRKYKLKKKIKKKKKKIKKEINECLLKLCILQESDEKYESVKYLVYNKNADVNFNDIHGNTPLINSCLSKDLKTIKLLVSEGANLNHENIFDQTPLNLSYNDFGIFKELVSLGADINHTSRYGENSLMYANLTNNKAF